MKRIVLILAWLLTSLGAEAQNNINVAGTVMDESGETLPGLMIQIKGSDRYTTTNADGRFRLEALPAGSTLVFSFVGYQSKEITYTASKERERIGMKQEVAELDEIVVTGRDSQRKISVVGAITNIKATELQAPAASITNMLGGRVPGIISVTRSGEPGKDFSEFWIRGISTFGANQGALILIDGIEGNLNDLDPADIESFSILKDASSTAVYGVRGANGVVVVTTKRGKAGVMRIDFKANSTLSYSPRMPEYTDAYNYALLANEARQVRGNLPLYTPTELTLYQTGLDPDLYPNVDWRDVILKKYTWNTQYYLSLSGGGENARYYVSLGALNSDALFKQDKESPFNANVNYHKYNFRANIDANVTRSTVLSLNMETVFITQNAPGFGDNNDALWAAQANLPPNIVPVRYSNGQLPAYGVNGDQMSPYVQLNYTGYRATERYSTKTNLQVKQDLAILTEGLSVQGLFSLSTNGVHVIYNNMSPDLYFADPKSGRNSDGSLRTDRKVEKRDLTAVQSSLSNRQYYFEAQANYNRVFDNDHRVTGLFHFYRQESKDSDWGNGIFVVIPKRYQAFSGRATYSYKDTYMVEGNLGYTGSENFNRGRRYGLFPSVALGWVPTQYEWIKAKAPLVNHLKLRGSLGQVGNDRLNMRFPYLTTVGGVNNGIWGGSAIGETQIGAPNMEWETTTKIDFGIDGKFWNNRIDLTIDFYRNKTSGIFQKRESIPLEAGLEFTLPYANIGNMTSWGFDGTAAYTHTFKKDIILTLRGNFTLARNKVDYWEQSGVNFPYQSYSGIPYRTQRGLVALGLFKDTDDIVSSPKQSWMEDVMPGDIKYKDVNGDGVVNDDDIVPLSFSDLPQIQYGFALEFNWRNIRVSALLEGVKDVQFFFGGAGYYPFAGGSTGNLLSIVADQNNRWTPASYSGTTATENPNARFPRLTYGDNPNNNRSSTFWLIDGGYLRLKSIELSWKLPQRWVSLARIFKTVELSIIGENLHVWDKVKLWDPAQASHNGAVYPLQRKFTGQLYITF